MPSWSKLERSRARDSEPRFSGVWEDEDGAEVRIIGTEVLGPDGDSIPLIFTGITTCSVELGTEVFSGKLETNEGGQVQLHWSDGKVWVQRPGHSTDQQGYQPDLQQPSLNISYQHTTESVSKETIESELGHQPNLRPANLQQPSPKDSNQDTNKSATAETIDFGKLWAANRKERLEVELQKIRHCQDANKRRTELRTLQLELHPDKQPEELRDHSKALFLLVQREWDAVLQECEANEREGGRPSGPAETEHPQTNMSQEEARKHMWEQGRDKLNKENMRRTRQAQEAAGVRGKESLEQSIGELAARLCLAKDDLCSKGDPRVVSAALAAADQNDIAVKLAAIQALSLVSLPGDKSVMSGLKARLDDFSAEVRARAARSLATVAEKTSHQSTILALGMRLHDTDISARAAAAEALVQVADRGDEIACMVVRARMKHSDPAVRVLVLEAFGQLAPAQDEEAAATLCAQLADPSPGVRCAVLAAAACVAGDSLLDTVCASLNDSSREVRIAALDALRKLAPPRHEKTISSLRSSIKDPEISVSSRARNLLFDLGGLPDLPYCRE